MRRTYVRGAIGVAVAAVGLAALAVPANAGSDTPSVALSGTVPSWAQPAAAHGAAPASTQLRLTVVLNLRNPAEAAALAAAVSNLASTSYRHYLSADAFRARFAPTSTSSQPSHWTRR